MKTDLSDGPQTDACTESHIPDGNTKQTYDVYYQKTTLFKVKK